MCPVVGHAMKPVGEPDAVAPHVRFDERGWETGALAIGPKLPRPSSTLPPPVSRIAANVQLPGVDRTSSRQLDNLLMGDNESSMPRILTQDSVTNMSTIDLPLPPSVNGLWRFNRGRVHRSRRYLAWLTVA